MMFKHLNSSVYISLAMVLSIRFNSWSRLYCCKQKLHSKITLHDYSKLLSNLVCTAVYILKQSESIYVYRCWVNRNEHFSWFSLATECYHLLIVLWLAWRIPNIRKVSSFQFSVYRNYLAVKHVIDIEFYAKKWKSLHWC